MGLTAGDCETSCPHSLKLRSPGHIGLSAYADKYQQSQRLKEKRKTEGKKERVKEENKRRVGEGN